MYICTYSYDNSLYATAKGLQLVISYDEKIIISPARNRTEIYGTRIHHANHYTTGPNHIGQLVIKSLIHAYIYIYITTHLDTHTKDVIFTRYSTFTGSMTQYSSTPVNLACCCCCCCSNNSCSSTGFSGGSDD